VDSVSFIFKRFFYSFLAGCVVNFYAIIYYYALEYYRKLPPFFEIFRLFINKNPSFVFIVFAIIISLIIEGICQVGIEKCFKLLGDEKLLKGKNANIDNINKLKDFLTATFKKGNYLLLFYIFIRPTIFWESIRYTTNTKGDKNPMKSFIDDSKGRNKSWKFYNGNSTYNAIDICAKVIEKEGKISDIYRYRDNSYVMQMLRLSFLGIMLFTLISGIIILSIDIITGCKELNDFSKYMPFFLFIIGTIVISFILFITTTNISSNFGKRYIREVGYTYEALKFDLLKNADRISVHKKTSKK